MKSKELQSHLSCIKRSGFYLYRLAVIILLFISYSSVTEGAIQPQEQVDLNMEYYQINDIKFLKLSLSIPDDDSQADLQGVEVNLYMNEISQATKLGNIIVEAGGSGKFELVEPFNTVTDTLYEYTFIASLKDHNRFADTRTELTIRLTELKIETFVEDSKNFVRATLKEKTATGEFIPVEWEELLFEVERIFGLLPVAEYGFTDDSGSVEIDYPDDMPGDEDGTIIIVVRLEEHPDYGNVEFREAVPWGVPVQTHTDIIESRTWMSRDAPLFFVMIFWGGLIASFTAIGYVIYNIYKISTDY